MKKIVPRLHPYFATGFVDGEVCFVFKIIKRSKMNTGYEIQLCFEITNHSKDLSLLENIKSYFGGIGSITKEGKNTFQHSKDSVLLDNISNYLGCGKCYSSRNEVNLTVSTFSDINKIISLFNKYPLLGTKKEDYLDFCKVAELIKSKDHLTKQGIENIKRIKSNMNSKRIH
jgi:hypothetical protein